MLEYGCLEEKVAQMEAQIWLLDSQIYAIRCFAGETVNFAHIRTGRNAPDTEPVIIYQKLRFLDEDLPVPFPLLRRSTGSDGWLSALLKTLL